MSTPLVHRFLLMSWFPFAPSNHEGVFFCLYDVHKERQGGRVGDGGGTLSNVKGESDQITQ